VGLAHRGAWPGPANGFGPLSPFGSRWKQGKPKPVACRSILTGRRQAAREGRVGVLVGAEGKPIGGSDREGPHRRVVSTEVRSSSGESVSIGRRGGRGHRVWGRPTLRYSGGGLGGNWRAKADGGGWYACVLEEVDGGRPWFAPGWCLAATWGR
jgi:hypothetical protein